MGQCAGARGCRAPSSSATGATVPQPVPGCQLPDKNERHRHSRSHLGASDLMRWQVVGPRCMWTWSAWAMRFVRESVCICECVFFGVKSRSGLSGPGSLWCLWFSALNWLPCQQPISCNLVQDCFIRHWLPEELSLLTCKRSVSLVFKWTLGRLMRYRQFKGWIH